MLTIDAVIVFPAADAGSDGTLLLQQHTSVTFELLIFYFNILVKKKKKAMLGSF